MRLPILFSILMIFSCSKEPIEISNEIDTCPIMLIEPEGFEEIQLLAGARAADLEGDCLKINVVFSGIDEGDRFDLVTDGVLDDSNPPKLTLKIKDHKPSELANFPATNKSFDISSIRTELGVVGDVMLRFIYRNTDEEFLVLYPE